MRLFLSFLLIAFSFSTRAIDVSFERTYYNSILLTNVKINGEEKTFKFIFDTGATESLISNNALNHLTNTKIKAQNIGVSDGYQEKEINQSTKLNISIDGFKFSNKKFIIHDDYLSNLSCDIDGVIGYNVIKDAVWGMNKTSITLQKSTTEIPSFDASKFYTQKLSINFGVPLVYMAFGEYYSTAFLFDTGFNSLISIAGKDHMKRDKATLFVRQGATKYSGVGTETGTSFGLVGSFQDSLNVLMIPDIRFDSFKKGQSTNIENKLLNGIASMEPDTEVTLPNIIGVEILDYYNIILDGKKKKLYTSLIDNTYNHYFTNSFGLSIIPISDGEYKVGAIWNHCSALGKIKTNDIVIKVNGIDLTDKQDLVCNTYKSLLDELRNNDSIQIQIKSNNGDIKVITLTKGKKRS